MGKDAPQKPSLFQALRTPLIFFIVGSFFYWVLDPTFRMLEIRQQRQHPYHEVYFTPNQKVTKRDTEKIYLSVIIPAYNEEERLPTMMNETLRYLSTKKYTYEVFDFYSYV